MPFPQPDAIWRGDICGVAEQTQICWYLHLSQQLGRQVASVLADAPPYSSWLLGTTLSVLLAPPMTQCAAVCSSIALSATSQLLPLCTLNPTGRLWTLSKRWDFGFLSNPHIFTLLYSAETNKHSYFFSGHLCSGSWGFYSKVWILSPSLVSYWLQNIIYGKNCIHDGFKLHRHDTMNSSTQYIYFSNVKFQKSSSLKWRHEHHALWIRFLLNLQNKTHELLHCHVIRNLSKTGGMSRDRNEDIWPNGKLPNVYHMQQAGRKRKWYLKWPLF